MNPIPSAFAWLALLPAGASSVSSFPLQEERLAGADALEVAVDPRVELVSVVFRLAGHPEYTQESSRSPYAQAAEAWFGPHGGHPAVEAARRLRRTRGISYDAPMSLAVHLTDPPELAPRVPFDAPPERLDDRWTPETAREMAGLLREFAADADFAGFLAEQRSFHAAVEERMREAALEHASTSWLDAFFGERARARFVAAPGLLNGGASYGCSVVLADGSQEILPVIGVWHWDAEGLPAFGEWLASNLVHELVHAYVNPIVEAHADRLREAGERIFAGSRPTMELQAYANWETVMYESLVRACVVRYVAATRGEDAARERVAYEEDHRGFEWTGALAELLARYEADRERYPDLASFVPEVAAFFDGYSVEYERRTALAPKVVSLSPANGADGVDPSTSELVVVFDRPMAGGSYSVVGGGPDFPEITGKPSFDAAGTTFRLPVRLEPGHTYRLGLNGLGNRGFRSRAGLPLQPVRVTFTTRGG